MIRRTQDEIVEHIKDVAARDFFGVQTDDLLHALDLTHAQEFLEPEAWSTWKASTEAEIRAEAREYLEFAVGKATDHRGLSANRSADHYSAFIWLLEPELFEGYEVTPYEQYGAPKLKAAATILDFTEEWDRLALLNPGIVNMAEKKPCREDCDEGCEA